MNPFKPLASLSIAAITLSPLTPELKADDYEKGFYGSIGLGAGTFSDSTHVPPIASSYDPGISYEGSLGYDFGKHFRVDVSYMNTTSSTSTNKDAIFGSTIFNAYIDLPIENTRWTPFVGVGYGSTNVDVVNLCSAGGTDDCTDDVATVSASGGLSYAINPDIDITGKFTYLRFESINIIDNETSVYVHESDTMAAHIGVTFKF